MIALFRYNKATTREFQDEIVKRHLQKGWLMQYYQNAYNDRLTMKYLDVKQVDVRGDNIILTSNENEIISMDIKQIDSMAIYNKGEK